MRLSAHFLALVFACLTLPSQADGLLRYPSPTFNAFTFSRLDSGVLTVVDSTESPLHVGVGQLAPQTNWISRHWNRQTDSTTHVGVAYSADVTTVLANGSGKNGPDSATYGRTTSVIKNNYGSPSAATHGELDGHFIFMRQGGPTPTTAAPNASDLNGIQANIGIFGSPGFGSFVEAVISRYDPSNLVAPTHQMDVQIGGIDAFGKNGEQGLAQYSSPNFLTWAYFATAYTALDRGLYITNGAGEWQDFIFLGSQGGRPYLRVKGSDGRLVFGPDGSSFTLRRNASNNSLEFLNAHGASVGSVYETGLLSMTGGLAGSEVRISGVPMLTRGNSLVLPPRMAPATPVNGEIWRDSATSVLRYFDGTTTNTLQKVGTAWTTYTPNVTTADGALASYSASARYQVSGKRLDMTATLSVNAIGTAGGAVNLSLPAGLVTAAFCSGSGREDGSSGATLQAFVRSGGSTLVVVKAVDQATALVNGAALNVSLSCEIS